MAAEEDLRLYDRTEDVEDALSIQRELTGIRGQVEEVQSRTQYLEQSTASSQISVGIRPLAEPPESPLAWNPALVAAKAWNAFLHVLQGLANASITTLVFGCWLAPVLLAALAGWRRWARPPSPDPGPWQSRPRPGGRSANLKDRNVAGVMLSALVRGLWGDLSKR